MMDARALVAYVGFYPVIRESGEHAALPSLSLAGSRIARHALYRAAGVTTLKCASHPRNHAFQRAQERTMERTATAPGAPISIAASGVSRRTGGMAEAVPDWFF
jgi:transposase